MSQVGPAPVPRHRANATEGASSSGPGCEEELERLVINRLRQVKIETRRMGFPFVFILPIAGQRHKSQVIAVSLPKLARDRVYVHLGQSDVKEHDRRMEGLR